MDSDYTVDFEDSWDYVELVPVPDDYDDQRENRPPSHDDSMYALVMLDPEIQLTPPKPPPRSKKNKKRKRKGQLRI